MQAGSNIFEKIAYYMEQDTLGVQILTYGITGVGLTAALRRVRPFARFTKPSDVPAHFIKSRTLLHGTVMQIEPNGGPFIMVLHKPVVNMLSFGEQDQLPITVAGVSVTSNGISWLQAVLRGNKIDFVPLRKHRDNVECTITLPQENKETVQIGTELVKLGFGTVRPLEMNLSKDKELLTYHKRLIAAQRWAERKRNGYWHFAIYPTLLWKMQNSISEKAKSVLPTFIVRRLNI